MFEVRVAGEKLGNILWGVWDTDKSDFVRDPYWFVETRTTKGAAQSLKEYLERSSAGHGVPWYKRKAAARNEREGWLDMAIEMVWPAVKDEADAIQMYGSLANALRVAGQQALAVEVDGIQRDESRHHGIVQRIKAQLEAMRR